MPPIKVRAAPGSLQRLQHYIERKDSATTDFFRLMRLHVPESIADLPDVQRACASILKAQQELVTALAIEMEAEAELGPEVFIIEQ
jgi:hypothetical protein